MCIACGDSRSRRANNYMQVLQGEFVFDDLPPPRKPTLASEFPNLATEWDFERNDDLKPDQVSPHSGKKVWWKCRNCGQSWQAAIDNRSRGRGCPYDSGRLPIPGKTDLKTLRPDLAVEWDYEKNGNLEPDQVTLKSNRMVWWKCSNCNQSWQARISSRSNGSNCPFDIGKLPILGKTDLATLHPDLAAEWDYQKNGNLTPGQFTQHSGKKIWWRCLHCNQSWQARISSRTSGSGCPYDSGRFPIPGKTDLETLHPDLVAEWDFEKNGVLTPYQVTPHSDKKIWWKCKTCGQKWQASIRSRVNGNRCPYDAGKLPIPGKTDLATLRPDIAEEWDHEKNGDLSPCLVTAFSNKTFWWKCKKCGQNWKATICSRSHGAGCPYDTGKLPIPGKTEFATLHPDLAAEWDYEKNGILAPEHVTEFSGKRVWWKCKKCGQSWRATIYGRSHGAGCPYDAGLRPILGKTDLTASCPKLAAEWDYEKNGILTPEQFTASSGKRVWWKCKNCGQSWRATIYSRSHGAGCPYDSGRFPIPGITDLGTLRPDLAAEWDYKKNGDLTPNQVTQFSNKRVWWKCKRCGQSWQAKIINRSYGRGCPYDANKLPILGKTDLATLRPDIVIEWDYEKNKDLMPEMFTVHSNKKVWWKCKKCGQNWQTTISARSSGNGCPYDTGRLPIPGKTDLKTLHPDLALEWDYDNNGGLGPENFTAKSHKKKWWKCRNCGKSWRTTIYHRANGTRCPNCK